MSEIVTKEDLKEFSLLLLNKIEVLIKDSNLVKRDIDDSEWVKSKSVRKLLDISAGSVQNLRTTQKIRFKKVLGSYYYSREDIQKLFSDEKD